MSEAARSRRDDPRYEPQVAVPGRDAPQPSSDPLAELARLVGHDDPFRSVFRPAPAPVAVERPAAHEVSYRGDAVHFAEAAPSHGDDDHPTYGDGVHGEAGRGHLAEPGYDDGVYDVDPGQHDAWRHDPAHHAIDDERYYAEEQRRHVDEAGIADERFADDAAASTLPDLWAQDGALEEDVHAPDHGAYGAAPGGERRSTARRPLAVLAAVLVLTGGGLAASFLAKGPAASGAAPASSGRGAPTILAAPGPTKVKVDDPGATAPEDQDAALLNKNGSVSSGPVKIVSSQEQPVDLGQLPKTSDLADGARPLPPASPSPFPEPKKVKTFVVHPDGSMLSPGAATAAVDGTGSVMPAAPTPALPATPRTASRGGTTPQNAAAQNAAPQSAPPQQDPIAALSAPPPDAVAAAPAKAARQSAAPGVRTASAKPNDVADAPSTSGGSYGVQLASSPVEADANAAFAKLKKKYPSQLGSLTASVHKAETGDKPVYRVRVGSMGQDEAKALCSQLQGAGGSCFVVRN